MKAQASFPALPSFKWNGTFTRGLWLSIRTTGSEQSLQPVLQQLAIRKAKGKRARLAFQLTACSADWHACLYHDYTAIIPLHRPCSGYFSPPLHLWTPHKDFCPCPPFPNVYVVPKELKFEFLPEQLRYLPETEFLSLKLWQQWKWKSTALPPQPDAHTHVRTSPSLVNAALKKSFYFFFSQIKSRRGFFLTYWMVRSYFSLLFIHINNLQIRKKNAHFQSNETTTELRDSRKSFLLSWFNLLIIGLLERIT